MSTIETSWERVPVAPMASMAFLISSETTRTTSHPSGRKTLAFPTFRLSMRRRSTAMYCPTLSGTPCSGVQNPSAGSNRARHSG
jgi:hypothetical protein